MVRKFCSCFVILLWQRILSEDPHKLEEPSPPHPPPNNKLNTNYRERAGHCCQAVIGPVNRRTSRSQLYSLCVFEMAVESQYSHQVYGASRIDGLVPSCALVFLVMKCYSCLFSLICSEAFSLVPLCIQVSFYSTCFSFLPSVLPWVLRLQ